MGYFEFKNNETPLNETNLLAIQKAIAELLLPIGSSYITQEDINPNAILGFGTWERSKGKVFVGLDENDTNFNAIGKTGGETEHTLTVEELAEHSHGVGIEYSVLSGDETPRLTSNPEYATSVTSKVGGNKPHNNLQPYEVVGYMWIRRA